MTQAPPPPRRSDDEWTDKRLAEVDEYIATIDRRAHELAEQAANQAHPNHENAVWAVDYDQNLRQHWIEEREGLLRRLGRT